MVRLKDGIVRIPNQTINQFQFLNGAIKRSHRRSSDYTTISFQFLNGAIKSALGVANAVSPLVFQFLNGAIKSHIPQPLRIVVNAFQFLNGAIKRKKKNVAVLVLAHFNSSMVRLKVLLTIYCAILT